MFESQYDLKQCTLYMVDGATPPEVLAIQFDEGTLKFTEKRNIEYKKNRGKLADGSVREGDEEPVEVSFEGRFTCITSQNGNELSISEFLNRAGAGTTLVTTGTDACAPYAVDLILERNLEDCGSNLNELVYFDEFRHESLSGDFKAGQISVSGKCNVTTVRSVRTTGTVTST